MKIKHPKTAYQRIVIACLFFVSVSARGQSNLVQLISPSGEYIGGGQTYYTTNEADIGISGPAATVITTAFGFAMTFDGPGASDLTVAQYSNAVRYTSNGGAAGLSVAGNGRDCTNVCGSFQVYEIQTNSTGQVVNFWATFSHRCECSAIPPLTGEIRYHSQLAPSGPLPRTLRAPGDFPTIQGAIDNASLKVAEKVLVAPGTYFEKLNFNGKAVTVVSEQGPAVTILDGNRSGTVITFESGEGSDSVISGFTIENGSAMWGAGISLSVSSPTITNNVFQNNAQQDGGAGAAIFGNGSSPNLQKNIFRSNSADSQYSSGTVAFWNSSTPLVANNVFLNNSCAAINMVLGAGTNSVVINNTIVSNRIGNRIWAGGDASDQIYANNILYGNTVGLLLDPVLPPLYPTWMHNLVSGGQNYIGIPDQAGTNGNISAAPFFACLPGNDFHPLVGSLCIDAGTNIAGLLPVTDFDGYARILAGFSNGPAVVDLGAFEFDPSTPPLPCLFLYCPSNMLVLAAPGQTSAVVNYPAPFVTPVAVISNSPPSGSVFPAGDNTVSITAVYDTNVMSCSFTITVLDLAVAMDATNLVWSTSGDVPWFVQTAVIRTGPAAVQSGTITNNQTSSLRTTLTGPGSLNFWWKVSSETNHDFLSFKVNGAAQATVSGQVDWRPQTVYFGEGPQTVEWTYTKDASASAGQDAGWVDGVSYTPGVTAPIITVQPVNSSQAIGLDATFSVTAVGTPPLSYKWQFNGTDLSGATSSSLVLTNVQLSNVGAYSVTVTNAAGSTNSTSATLTVIVFPPGVNSRVVAWGANSYGQTNVPPDLTNAIAIAGGWYHSVALRADGTVKAWGRNHFGQTNVPVSLSNVVAIASRSGNHSAALRADGTVVAWGYNGSFATNVPTGLSNVVAIAAGGTHCLALKADGRVVSWGQFAGVPTGLSNVVAIAAGDNGSSASLALKSDGTVLGWGGTIQAGLSNAVAIAAGGLHGLALKADGSLVSWGNNSDGQRNVPASLSNVVAIAAGDYHSLALQADGTAVAWGQYYTGSSYVPAAAMAGLSNVVAIAAGSDHDLVLLGSGPPVTQALADNAQRNGNAFNLSLPTQSGRTYRLEYKNDLLESDWTALPLIAGTGGTIEFTDPTATSGQRFYRVRRW